jgi:hypothetical protein
MRVSPSRSTWATRRSRASTSSRSVRMGSSGSSESTDAQANRKNSRRRDLSTRCCYPKTRRPPSSPTRKSMIRPPRATHLLAGSDSLPETRRLRRCLPKAWRQSGGQYEVIRAHFERLGL